MKYDVIWLPDAEQELAEVWLNAPNRNLVSQAAFGIDLSIEADPNNVGESRPNERRIFFVPPLGIIYRVLESPQRVEVIHVWRFNMH
jgi:plasmid stabilization system protein ParE